LRALGVIDTRKFMTIPDVCGTERERHLNLIVVGSLGLRAVQIEQKLGRDSGEMGPRAIVPVMPPDAY